MTTDHMAMDEGRRRAILTEIMESMPDQHEMEPWQFTVMDLAGAMGWQRARTERYLRQEVATGRMRMDLNGHDPRTGRRAALYWRIDDEPQAETAERREGEPSEELA